MNSNQRIFSLALVFLLVLFLLPGLALAGVEYDENGYSSTAEGVVLQDQSPVYIQASQEYWSTVIATLHKGDKVTIRSRLDEFYAIDLNGDLGYILSDLVEISSGNPRVAGVHIKGDQKMTVGLGDTYAESGYFAYDQYGNDVADAVSIYGSVNTNRLDTYVLTYTYENSYFRDKPTREVTVVRKMNTDASSQYEQKKSEIEKGKWRYKNFVSQTGLVAVDVWIEGINEGKAVLKATNTWLGKGTGDYRTMLPSRSFTYSNIISYEAQSDGEYPFVLYEDGVATLRYSITVDGVGFLNRTNMRVSMNEMGVTRSEYDVATNLKELSFDFDRAALASYLAKLLPHLQMHRVTSFSSMQKFAVGLMFNNQHHMIKELINDEISVDKRVFSDLSDCEKCFMISMLYAYEFNEIRIPENQEQLDALINDYVTGLAKAG